MSKPDPFGPSGVPGVTAYEAHAFVHGEADANRVFGVNTTCSGIVDPDEIWMCEEPNPGVRYRVVREMWSDDYTERFIYEIEVVTRPFRQSLPAHYGTYKSW